MAASCAAIGGLFKCREVRHANGSWMPDVIYLRENGCALLAQTELFDQDAIAVGIARLEIIVCPVEPRRRQADLALRRAGVACAPLMLGDHVRLFLNRYCHCFTPT